MRQQESYGIGYLGIGGKLLVETIKQIENKVAPRQKQGEDFSMAPMLSKQMAKIDWKNQTSMQIKNLARGLDPIMGAYTIYENKKIKLWKIKIANDFVVKENEIPGQIVIANDKEGLFIKTFDGVIEVVEIQGENGKRMKTQDFLRGNKLKEGYVLQ